MLEYMSFQRLFNNLFLFVLLIIQPFFVMAQTESATLEEIVVTARKIDESLQEIPVAVTALDGERLQRGIINDVRDLNSVVPTLNVTEVFGGQTLITMRGLGNTATNSGEDPAVVVHVDGAVIGRPEIQNMAMFDLERVEVSRGPQGTVYGRNATGGAINLVTAKPTEELDGYINLSGGNFDYAEASAAVSGPLTERILGRVAYNFIQRGGFAENLVTGNDVQDDKRQLARGHLQFNITEDVELLLTADYGKRDDASNAMPTVQENFPGSTDPVLIAPGRGGFPPNGNRDVAMDVDPQLEQETWAVTGTLDWRINDRFSTKLLVNYREHNLRRVEDLDNSSVVNSPETTGRLATISEVLTSGEQFNAELQFHHQGDVFGRHLQAMVGFFYFDEQLASSLKIGTANKLTVDPVTSEDPPWFFVPGTSDVEPWSAFWNLTYDLTDQIALRAGGRFTDEDRSIDNDMFLIPGGVGDQIVITDLPVDGKRNFSEYTSEFGIDFKPTRDMLFYFTFSEGFKSGAGLLSQFDSPITGPTTVENYEFGLKSQWLDRTLTVNLTGFILDVEGAQRRVTIPDPDQGGIIRFTNGVQMENSGIELDASWNVTNDLRINAAGAYLDAVGNPEAGFVNVAGNTPMRSPDWKFNIRGEYDFHLEGHGTVTAGTEVTYTDDTVLIEDSKPLRDVSTEEAYTILDANIRYTPPSGNWHITVWGKNLTDKKVNLVRIPGAFTGAVRSVFNSPLTIGGTFHYDFF